MERPTNHLILAIRFRPLNATSAKACICIILPESHRPRQSPPSAIIRWADEQGLRGKLALPTVTFTANKKRARPAFEIPEYRRLCRTMHKRISVQPGMLGTGTPSLGHRAAADAINSTKEKKASFGSSIFQKNRFAYLRLINTLCSLFANFL